MKTDWTDKLFKVLWDETKITCPWTFHNAWTNGDKILIDAVCHECSAILEGETSKDKLIVSITGCDRNFRHQNRRKLAGKRRQEVIQMLKSESSTSVQSSIINSEMQAGDSMPAHVPTKEVLRQAIYLANLEQLPDKDPMESLLKLKSSSRDTIFNIAISPFYVFYWTPIQRQQRRERMTVTIDATGSLIQPPASSEKMQGRETLKHVFLYSILAKVPSNKSVPICQMITQTHTAAFISFWLQTWLNDVKKPPKEVIIDESKALFLAVLRAFTSCSSVKEYLKRCMAALVLNSETLPECYIRYDRSHLVKNFTRRIKDKDKRRERFFKAVFGFLIQCNDWTKARKVISDFYTVILNKYDGDGKPEVEMAKQNLQKVCSEFEVNIE